MKQKVKGLIAIAASALLLAASVPLFLSAQEPAALIPPSGDYYILGNGLGYAEGDATDRPDWVTAGMNAAASDAAPDGKGLSYTSISAQGAGGEITFPVKTADTPFDGVKNVAFWMKTPPKADTEQAYGFFVDVDEGGGNWQGLPATQGGSYYYHLIGMDGTMQTVKSTWSVTVPFGFEGYVVVDTTPIAYDPAKLKGVRLRELYDLTYMTGKTVYLDNIGAVSDLHGFANAVKEEAAAGSVKSGDYYLVGNPLSRREDIAWSPEKVNAGMATASPDGSCMTYQPSDKASETGPTTDDTLLFHVVNDLGQFTAAPAFAFWAKIPDVGADKSYAVFLDAFCAADPSMQFVPQNVFTYYLIGTDGTMVKKTSDYAIGLPGGFEGYVAVETATYAHVTGTGDDKVTTPMDVADVKSLQLRSDWNQAHMVGKDVCLDNFGAIWDVELFAALLQQEVKEDHPATTTATGDTPQPSTATTAPAVTDIHQDHPDNQGMVVGCGFEKEGGINQWTTKTLDAKVVKDVSPDKIGAQFTLPEGTQGEFYVDIDTRDDFAGAKAIVFWIKTSDAASQFFFDAASRKKDDPDNNFEKFAMAGGATSDIILVSAKDGAVIRRKTAAKVDLPANFEGYVILPATNFSEPMGTGFQQETFAPERFNLFCIRPEWSQASQAGKTFYVDDFGLTADVEAYIQVLQTLYGDGSVDPGDHAKHPDNKGAAIGCGFESETDFSAWTSKTIQTAIVKGISPDGSCGQFTLGAGTQGEMYMNVNPDAFKDYDGKAVVFWIKAPDADGFFYTFASSNKADGSGFEKFGLGSGKIQLVSAKNGSVVEKEVAEGITIPAGFEGYVVIPTALFNKATGEDFEAQALVPERFMLFALNPNWNQTGIENKAYHIDDIGLVADVEAYTAMLSELYLSDEPDNPGGDEEPGGDETPDYAVTSTSDKVVIDGVMIRVAKGMTVREVLACLQVADAYTLVVVDRDGNAVGLDTPMASGMRLKVMQDDLSVANYNFALTDGAADTQTTGGDDGEPGGDSAETGDALPAGMILFAGISAAAALALLRRRKTA